MPVPLKPQHSTTRPLNNTRKVVSTTGKTTSKRPGSRMKKTPRKKLHRGTKANRRHQILQILTTTMMMMTKPVPRTTPATSTAKALVVVTAAAPLTGIPTPEETPRNECGSWARARYRKRLVLWQRPKHPRRQNWEKTKLVKSKNKIARKGKSAKNLVKNSSKTAGRKKWGFTEGSATTTCREARSNSRSAHENKLHKKIRPCFRSWLWQRPKHPCRQNREKFEVGKK